MSMTWGSERLLRSLTHKASPAWSLGSRIQGMAFLRLVPSVAKCGGDGAGWAWKDAACQLG